METDSLQCERWLHRYQDLKEKGWWLKRNNAWQPPPQKFPLQNAGKFSAQLTLS